MLRPTFIAAALLALTPFPAHGAPPGSTPLHQDTRYAALVSLFEEWRAFQPPALRDGVPDHSEAGMALKAAALPGWKQRLAAISTDGWSVEQRNDHKLIEAEMNGFDFELRVLRPWARDPAFYMQIWPSRSDVPLREGPAIQPDIALHAYTFPLSRANQSKLAAALATVPGVLAQAEDNLRGSNARDLWLHSLHMLREQARALGELEAGTLNVSTLEGSWTADLEGASPELRKAVREARTATDRFIAWVEAEAPKKTGPSGVGKENYSWYQRNVHFVPFGWDEEVALVRRELERAQAALKLEEHRNRALPPLAAVTDEAEFQALSRRRLDRFVRFLVEQDIIPDKPYLKAAIAPQIGHFVPENRRTFFAQVTHREPMLLFSHDYHWIDLARMRDEPHPSPIRRVASLSNIWDGRAEGFATAFEELMMAAGLYDDVPRARELVWIMLANRAARGLASLHVQANEWAIAEAGRFHGEWTPRGWAKAGDELTAFEQLLYLRQPGYGTSYVTGKLLLDRLIADAAHKAESAGKPFALRDFLDAFNRAGMIPIPLISDELLAR